MAAQTNMLRAGVAKSDITTDTRPNEIRDPLYAKALVLDDGAKRIAIVTMDTTSIGGRHISQRMLDDVGEQFLPNLRSRVESELDIPGSHVLVNASHTHPPGRLLCDDDQQVARTFDAISRAVHNLTEVRVGAGVGREDRITINRSLRLNSGQNWTIRHANPCPPDEDVASLGPTDPEIGIIRIDRLDGSPLAVVYNFACHLLFGDTRGSITGNFPAIASKCIEETLGGDVTAMFLQGACGDIIDITFKDFARPRDIEPLGTMLAMSTLKAWRDIQTGPATLNVLSQRVELPRRTDIPSRIDALRHEQADWLESLRGTSLNFKSFLPLYLQQQIAPDNPSDDAYRYMHDELIGSMDRVAMDEFNRNLTAKYLQNIRAMERLVVIQEDISTLIKHKAVNDASGSATISAEVQGIRIGDAAVITSPAELFAEIGISLKESSPHQTTLVAPFSNGYLHYGAPADSYDRGGYEVAECLLAPQWREVHDAAAVDILRQL